MNQPHRLTRQEQAPQAIDINRSVHSCRTLSLLELRRPTDSAMRLPRPIGRSTVAEHFSVLGPRHCREAVPDPGSVDSACGVVRRRACRLAVLLLMMWRRAPLGHAGKLLGVYRSTGALYSGRPVNSPSRHPPGSADRGPLVAALLQPRPIEDRQLPNTFSARTTVILRSAYYFACVAEFPSMGSRRGRPRRPAQSSDHGGVHPSGLEPRHCARPCGPCSVAAQSASGPPD
jgi:hypothetical protein